MWIISLHDSRHLREDNKHTNKHNEERILLFINLNKIWEDINVT